MIGGALASSSYGYYGGRAIGYYDDGYYDDGAVAVAPPAGDDVGRLLHAAIQVLRSGVGHLSRL